MLQPGTFGADVCQHIDRPDLAGDPRFATAEQIAANTGEAVKLLQEVIGARTLAEWAERFATLAGPWAPVQDTLQAGGRAAGPGHRVHPPPRGGRLSPQPPRRA